MAISTNYKVWTPFGFSRPFLETFHLKFAGDTVALEREMNCGPASDRAVTLAGKAL